MDQQAILERVLEVVSKVPHTSTSRASMESTLKDVDLDSLGLVEATLAVEDEFGVIIPDEELEAIDTVGDVVRLVSKLLDSKK